MFETFEFGILGNISFGLKRFCTENDLGESVLDVSWVDADNVSLSLKILGNLKSSLTV